MQVILNDLRKYSLVITIEKAKLSYRIIRGMDNEDEDEDDDDESNEDEDKSEKEVSEDNYTQEQVDAMRLVITTPNRSKLLDKYSRYASGGQSGMGFMMFDTNTGNSIISQLSSKIKTAMNADGWDQKFDHLFALTAALLEYDTWVHDNEFHDKGGM
jgi:hypothetical protein